MGILIDTGVFICWERDDEKIDLGSLSVYGEPAISVVTQSELLVGVHRANSSERREKRMLFVQAILTNVAILPVDSRTAEVHARIVAIMSELGTKIGPHDNWIAATSLVFGIPLLTTNSKEFQRVANLRVIDFLSMT